MPTPGLGHRGRFPCPSLAPSALLGAGRWTCGRAFLRMPIACAVADARIPGVRIATRQHQPRRKTQAMANGEHTLHEPSFTTRAEHERARLHADRRALVEEIAPILATLKLLERKLRALDLYLDAHTAPEDREPEGRKTALVVQIQRYLSMMPKGLSAQEIYTLLTTEDPERLLTLGAVHQSLWRHKSLFRQLHRGVYVLAAPDPAAELTRCNGTAPILQEG